MQSSFACNSPPPPSTPLSLFGTQCILCTLPIKTTEGEFTTDCYDTNLSSHSNTVRFTPGTAQVTVNGDVFSCGTRSTPENAKFACGTLTTSPAAATWLMAAPHAGKLTNVSCNIPSRNEHVTTPSIYGSQCASCKPPIFDQDGHGTVQCHDYGGLLKSNTVYYDPELLQFVVNGAPLACGVNKAPLFAPGFPCDVRPSNPVSLPWLYADNVNGALSNLACNVPIAEPGAFRWASSSGSALGAVVDWSGHISTLPFKSVADARAFAGDSAHLASFFYAQKPFSVMSASVRFSSGDAIYFPATPALGGDWYAKTSGGWTVNPGPGVGALIDWSRLVSISSNSTIDAAKSYASAAGIPSFLFVNRPFLVLGGTRTLSPGEAVFFSSGAALAPSGWLYAKVPSALAQRLNDGLLAYYSFDVGAFDDSGLGHDAKAFGPVSYREGYRRNAVRLSGDVGAAVKISSTLAQTRPASFGLAAWVHIEASTIPASGLARIIGPLALDRATGRLVYSLVSKRPPCPAVSMRSEPLNAGQWTHVAVTADAGTATASLFVNATLADSASVPFLAALSSAPWGSAMGGSAFAGSVDEAFLYSRALAQPEIVLLADMPHVNRRRHAIPLDVDTRGKPGYSRKWSCWGFFKQLACKTITIGLADCYGCSLVCDQGTADSKGICSCPTGYTVATGGGCVPAPARKTPDITISAFVPLGSSQRSALPQEISPSRSGYVAEIKNASWAEFDVTDRDEWPSQTLIRKFIQQYCDGGQKTSVNTALACPALRGAADVPYPPQKCGQLDMQTTDSTLLRYPFWTIREWANNLSRTTRKHKLLAFNTNFWYATKLASDSTPCGAPLGNLQRNDQTSAIKPRSYDSLTIYKTNNGNDFDFTQPKDQPSPHDSYLDKYQISGYLIRHNGKDVLAKNGTKNFKSAKPELVTGRTALGYDRTNDVLKVIVVPKTSPNGLNVSSLRKQFATNYTEVLVLDGGGSSQLVYWEDGKEMYSAPTNDQDMRNVPAGMFIDVP